MTILFSHALHGIFISESCRTFSQVSIVMASASALAIQGDRQWHLQLPPQAGLVADSQ